MNDFTKEELEYLVQCVTEKINVIDSWDNEEHLNWVGGIESKIQSMIDNYCEHEFDIHDYLRDKCTKCGVYSNENQ
jgi:hypothetical protein